MNIRHLSVFLTLSKTLHFGKTADQHSLSPSALSRLIQRMEQEAGAVLFERDNRQVKLTASGDAYVDFAEKVVIAWAGFQSGVNGDASALSGEVSLYCSVTASHSLLNPLLASLRSSYPEVDIHVNTGDQALSIERLKQESEDFAIAARPSDLPAGVHFKRLSASKLVFIAPREGPIADAMAHSDNRRVWAELPWVLAERGLSRQRLDQWFRRHSIRPKVYAQVSGHEAIASMVSLGFGVGLLPELVLSNSPVSDKLHVFSAQDVMSGEQFDSFDVGLSVLKRKLASPLISAIWDSVQPQ